MTLSKRRRDERSVLAGLLVLMGGRLSEMILSAGGQRRRNHILHKKRWCPVRPLSSPDRPPNNPPTPTPAPLCPAPAHSSAALGDPGQGSQGPGWYFPQDHPIRERH